MKNIVITGATSFIAVKLIQLLADNDALVYAVIRPNSVHRKYLPTNNNVRVVELDMSEIEKLSDLIKAPIDYFYHFAWQGTRGCDRADELLQRENYRMSVTAIETAGRLGARVFIGAGSQAEYGRCKGVITEETAADPQDAYGKYKYQVYNEGMKFAEMSIMKFIWGRIFSTYGIHDYENTLISSCIRKMLLGESVLLSPCTHLWDYLYVDDAANAFYCMGIKEVDSGAYNIASGDIRSLKDYVNELKEILQSDSKLLFGSIPYEERGPVQIEPVIQKLLECTDWRPKITFREGIKTILEDTRGKE